MANSTDVPFERFRVELGGGEVVEPDGSMIVSAGGGDPVPALRMVVSASRGHALAHLVDEWSRAFRLSPSKASADADRALVDALEAVAAELGEPGAVRCASRVFDGVTAPQRLAAVAVLAEREERLSPVQRFAVVDAAARWLQEDAGDELAYALLAAVCSTDVTTNHAYLALLAHPGEVSPS